MVVVVAGAHEPDASLASLQVPHGWSRRDGFELPDEPWDLSANRWICVGVVRDDDSARAALGALVRGVGVAVQLEGPSGFRLRVLDDLHHNGAVSVAPPTTGPTVTLRSEDVALLEALAEGKTVEEAARDVGLSARTAHRRLASVRGAYGASNTTEAVARWLAEDGVRPRRPDRS